METRYSEFYRLVCDMNPHLEDVESLELDVGAFVSEQVHHQLQVLRLADVARHHREVMSVQQQLTQKLRTDYQRQSPLDWRGFRVDAESLIHNGESKPSETDAW